MKPRKIVIVDDMAKNSVVRVQGRRHDCEIRSIPPGERVLWMLAAEHCEVLVVEAARVPSTAAVWPELFGGRVDPPLLIVVGDRASDAVTVSDIGVHDYVEKPFTLDRLMHTIERALDHFDLRRDNRELRDQLGAETNQRPQRERAPSVSHVGRRSNLAEVYSAFEVGSVREMERLMIMERLKRHNQNRTHAAKTLEISVRTLRNKLREYRRDGLIEERALAVR